jgi:hypothetical protein
MLVQVPFFGRRIDERDGEDLEALSVQDIIETVGYSPEVPVYKTVLRYNTDGTADILLECEDEEWMEEAEEKLQSVDLRRTATMHEDKRAIVRFEGRDVVVADVVDNREVHFSLDEAPDAG